ncbi:MAG: hypothetical protein IPP91_11140 [Betaproteobacteria bacterium]|nr:hypothetical protein [Betaproteobacteria bacterium]
MSTKVKSGSKPAPKRRGATAVHATDGKKHVIGIDALRVLILEDEGGYFAQGLEIDYAASGESVDEVKQNFSQGLMLTMDEHLKMHGHLEKFLVPAPAEAWKELFHPPAGTVKAKFSCVRLVDIERKVAKPRAASRISALFPFGNLAFIEPQRAAA